MPKGMESDQYLKNPVIAGFRRYDRLTIGNILELNVK
jgi:hypothetical protein